MKKIILAVALSTFVAGGALAEDNRDQAFGKHDMGPSPDSNMDRNTTPTGSTRGMATTLRATERSTIRHSKKADR
jgi:hypothetical protein